MSHIYPVGKYRKMQFELDNVKTLCQRHHLYWWHKNPIEASAWIETKLSKRRLAKLKKMSNTIIKAPLDYEEIKDVLERAIKELS